MVITQTPFRMSFFGGGTDMEDYFREYNGAVLSTTFNKYCYVNVRHLPRFFDYANELSYSRIERVQFVEEINHPAIRNAMKMLDIHEIRLTYEADLPAKSGLGTSSSFAVGMLNAFYALKGKYADKKKIADDAIYLERVLCNEAGGWQDQIAASYGGFNRINFNSGGYDVLPVIISPEKKKKLNNNLMMFFTGFTRFSADIQKENSAKNANKTAKLKKCINSWMWLKNIGREKYRFKGMLVTNGLKLDKQQDDFWKACRNNDIKIEVIRYPANFDYNSLLITAEKHHVDFSFYGRTKYIQKTQYYLPFDVDGNQNPQKSFYECFMARSCFTLCHGKLYPCSPVAYIDRFNKVYNQNLEITNDDYVDIYRETDTEKILDKLGSPIHFCRYCDIGKRTYGNKWMASKKDINEWT